MANGIKVPGRWVPGTTAGVVVESKYVKGGYITVSSIEERDELISGKLEVVTPGTKIYVANIGEEFIYVEEQPGQGKFEKTLDKTLEAVEADGFVRESDVTTIFEDKATDIIKDVANEVIPGMVKDQVDEEFKTISADIAKEATDIATKEAVKQVTEIVQNDFVSTDKLNEELETVNNSIQENYYNKEEIDKKLSEAAIDVTLIDGGKSDSWD